MSDEVYAKAYSLQKEIAELKELMKEKEDELNCVIHQIVSEGVKGIGYSIEAKTKPSRKANPKWFRENRADFYNQFAHVSHPVAVSIMSDICGGYSELQDQIRTARPDEFHENATINLVDIQKEFGDDAVQVLETVGAIETEPPKSYKVVMLPQFLAEMNRKAAEASQ